MVFPNVVGYRRTVFPNVVGYRRMVFLNGMRAPEEKEAIHVRVIEKMTAITDEEILDEWSCT